MCRGVAAARILARMAALLVFVLVATAPLGANAMSLQVRTCIGGVPCSSGCASSCDAVGGCAGGLCTPFANTCGAGAFCGLREFCGADNVCHLNTCEERLAQCPVAKGQPVLPVVCPMHSNFTTCLAAPDGSFSCQRGGGVVSATCGLQASRGFEGPTRQQALLMLKQQQKQQHAPSQFKHQAPAPRRARTLKQQRSTSQMPSAIAQSNGNGGGWGSGRVMGTLLSGLGGMVTARQGSSMLGNAQSILALRQVANAYNMGSITGSPDALGLGQGGPYNAGSGGGPFDPNAYGGGPVFNGGAADGGNYNPYFETYGPGFDAPTKDTPVSFSNSDGWPATSNQLGGVALVAIDRTYWPDAPANITYPCPEGFGDGQQIAPGIPCGVALTAIPANMLPTLGCGGILGQAQPFGGIPCAPEVLTRQPISGGGLISPAPSGPAITPAPTPGALAPAPGALAPAPAIPAPTPLPGAPASPPATPQWVWVNNQWVWQSMDEGAAQGVAEGTQGGVQGGQGTPSYESGSKEGDIFDTITYESGEYTNKDKLANLKPSPSPTPRPPSSAPAAPSAAPARCPIGTIFSSTYKKCVSCVAGAFADSKLQQCRLCNPGYFAPAKGTSACKPCAPGTAVAAKGATICKPCPGGMTSGRAAAKCVAAPPPPLHQGPPAGPSDIFGDITSRH